MMFSKIGFLLCLLCVSSVVPALCYSLSSHEVCQNEIDLVFVLDESGSVGKKNWDETMVPFVTAVMAEFKIGPGAVLIDIVRYNTNARKVILHPGQDVERDIKRLLSRYRGGQTATGIALDLARKTLAAGRSNAYKLVILLTDGATNHGHSPIGVSKIMRDEGTTIMVVGINGGGSFSEGQCLSVAGCTKADKCPMYQLATWDNATSLTGKVSKEICNKIATNAACIEEVVYGSCSESCGDGVKSKTSNFVETDPPTVGSDGVAGKTCKEQRAATTSDEPCNDGVCDMDAVCSTDFDSWTSCSVPCGDGKRSRERKPVITSSVGKGKTCDEQELKATEVSSCREKMCEVDAVCAPFGEWSACSVTCGNGTRTHERTPEVSPAEHGGKTCHDQGLGQTEEEKCNVGGCPVIGAWETWSSCSVTCGSGVVNRTRSVTTAEGQNTVLEEFPGKEEESCKLAPCAKMDEPAGGGGNTAAIAGGIIGGLALLGGAGAAAYHVLGSGASAAGSAASAGETGMDASAEVFEANEEGIVVDVASDSWG